MPKTQTTSAAHCTECGITHTRPAGVKSEKNHNVSDPVLTEPQEQDMDFQYQHSELHSGGAIARLTDSSMGDSKTSQVTQTHTLAQLAGVELVS